MYPPDSPRYSSDSAAFNRPVRPGAGKKLVPFDALSVRVCRYGSLNARYEGGSVLSPAVTSQFEGELNRFVAVPVDSAPFGCGVGGPAYYLTFANGLNKVNLWSGSVCSLTNGVLVAAQLTMSWFNELRGYTTRVG